MNNKIIMDREISAELLKTGDSRLVTNENPRSRICRPAWHAGPRATIACWFIIRPTTFSPVRLSVPILKTTRLGH